MRATFPYGVTFMIHDRAYNSPSLLQHAASNPSWPKVMAVTTRIITHSSFCVAAAPFSSPCLHEICLDPAVRECIYLVQAELFSGCWCWLECPPCPFSPTTHVCAHIRADPLLLPPVLLSIPVGCGVVGVDGGWQDLDCWGKDDGASCSDSIALFRDSLEGLITLLWKLFPLRPLAKQMGGYSSAKYKHSASPSLL